MAGSKFDCLSDFSSRLGATLKGVVKVLLQSRRCTVSRSTHDGGRLVVMGNGPSLADSLRDNAGQLAVNPLLAVNFMANTPEFYRLRPRYYVLADPLFFVGGHENVDLLWQNVSSRVDWPMTLFVPAKYGGSVRGKVAGNVTVECFNPIGFEGFGWMENMVYASGRGMPRPRNVLIPSLMIGMLMGYREIYVIGADHSWTRTLEVNESNEVVSVQPHFYKDNEQEHQRVTSVYRNIRLHEIMYSFHVAFKAYFAVRRYAVRSGAVIYNATPGSFIDAFERRSLSEI